MHQHPIQMAENSRFRRRQSVILRKLLPSDVRAYRELRHEVILSSPMAFASSAPEERAADDQRFLLDISPKGRGCVLGAFDGSLLGVTGLRTEEKTQTAHKGLLFGMAIRQKARGQGIGRNLIQAILMEARALGLRQVVLAYTEGNEAAEHLYRSCEFVEFGRESRAVIVDGIDHVRIHMIRMLD
jgi:RimJ/RimL family protein N-acetyltransferase